MATIREVATRSGVSTATVSHVVNGKLEKVSPVTRSRVLAAIRDLGYRPPAMEDRQGALASKTLGVVVPDIGESPVRDNEYLSGSIDGILDRALHLAWSATIFAERVWVDVGQSIRRAYDGRCDGVIVIAPSHTSPLVEGLIERGVPVVLLGTSAWTSGMSSVDIDNVDVGARAARTFLDAGHATFGYFGPSPTVSSSGERERAFRGALVQADVHPSRVLSFHCDGSPDQVGLQVKRMLDLGRGAPTALMGWNDDLARELVRALATRDRSVPTHHSVIGVDDHAGAVNEKPFLSSFRQTPFDLARQAVDMLVNRVEDPSSPDETLRVPTEFISRESVAAPPHHLH